MLAALGRVAEWRESFPLESGNRFGVGLEIDHIARNEPNHPAIDENARAAEHAAHVDRPELSK